MSVVRRGRRVVGVVAVLVLVAASFCGHGDPSVFDFPDAEADAGADAGADADADADAPMTRCDEGYLDSATSLCWQDPPRTDTFNWGGAVAYCDDLSLAGHGPGSWRLPTISELRSLVRGCPATGTGGACGVTDECLAGGCHSSSCQGCSSASGPGAGGAYWPAEVSGPVYWYWSSSTHAGVASDAWYVGFGRGCVYSVGKPDTGYVRCVRRGP